ncbi:MAG: hypothetical protein KTR14_06020, partial [Vampirovibrio sp.]|nr:hypothetical protein [Vampirovibrio sp.]
MPRYNPPNHDACSQTQERQAVLLSRTAPKGVSLAEYSLIFGILISLAIPSVGLLGGSVSQNMNQIVAAFQQGPLAAIFGGGPIANNPGGGNAGAGGGSNNNGNGGANNG